MMTTQISDQDNLETFIPVHPNLKNVAAREAYKIF